jgi:V/A-type H+-transporting ATPase subunit I
MAWLPPVLFNFHGVVSGQPGAQSLVRDLFDILAISIYFGIGVIGMGLLFNWVNLLRKKRWSELLVGQAGLTGGWIFGGGVYAAYYLVGHGYRKLPPSLPLFFLVGLPAIAIFLKPFLVHFLGLREEPGTSGDGGFTILNLLMSGVVELLEVFSGYLSNTLSFLRVAGLGIAHVSLMTAFFELARMASGNTLYAPGALAILLAGNILVIGLEGLSAGVQSLRLNYYEFFTKFFTGTGTLYSPVSLRSSAEGRI